MRREKTLLIVGILGIMFLPGCGPRMYDYDGNYKVHDSGYHNGYYHSGRPPKPPKNKKHRHDDGKRDNKHRNNNSYKGTSSHRQPSRS